MVPAFYYSQPSADGLARKASAVNMADMRLTPLSSNGPPQGMRLFIATKHPLLSKRDICCVCERL